MADGQAGPDAPSGLTESADQVDADASAPAASVSGRAAANGRVDSSPPSTGSGADDATPEAVLPNGESTGGLGVNRESALLIASSGQIDPEARTDPDGVLEPGERFGRSEPGVVAGLDHADADGSAASGALDIDPELMAPLALLSGHTEAELLGVSLDQDDPGALADPDCGFGRSEAGWLSESSGQIDPETLFGPNADPGELTGSEDHAEPVGLSEPDAPDGLGAPARPDDPDGLAVPHGLGASRSSADALSVGVPRVSSRASGEPKGSAVGTESPRPTYPDSSLLRSAGWPSWPGRLLCAPICTTSSSAASVNTTQPDRRADRVKKPAKIRQRFRATRPAPESGRAPGESARILPVDSGFEPQGRSTRSGDNHRVRTEDLLAEYAAGCRL